MKKKTIIAASLLFFVAVSTANAAGVPDLGSTAQDILNSVKKLWIPIILIVFIVTALFNIGDVMGEHKNYQAFFKKLGLFVGAVAITMAIIVWLATQSI